MHLKSYLKHRWKKFRECWKFVKESFKNIRGPSNTYKNILKYPGGSLQKKSKDIFSKEISNNLKANWIRTQIGEVTNNYEINLKVIKEFQRILEKKWKGGLNSPGLLFVMIKLATVSKYCWLSWWSWINFWATAHGSWELLKGSFNGGCPSAISTEKTKSYSLPSCNVFVDSDLPAAPTTSPTFIQPSLEDQLYI